jgi:aerotaxis receptor
MQMNDQLEYLLPEGEVIITHTDADSRITYANPAFLTSSEYSLEECMGQPQNVVRHPDMPKEAFADLWQTIRAGKCWTGIVKNRRKNGGFYWVRANVTPKMSRGRIIGYMSVRVRPSREEIRAAEGLYAAIRAGRAGSVRLVEGKIEDISLQGRIAALTTLSLRTGTWLFVGLVSALIAGMTLSSLLASGFTLHTWAGLLATGLALSNLIYVQTKVVRPLRTLQRGAMQLVSGDTSSRIPVEGVSCVRVVTQSLEQVRVKLDGVLKDNMAAATRVRDGVAQVVRANTDLSGRTSQHAASLEQTAASLEQLTATVTRNTDNARHAAQMATQSSVSSSRGCDVVVEVHETMRAISATSARIGEIVSIIDGIAFQTNLLALNAAVEAARAGEQGRSFAVVAQEVRSLAQRSASAAKEIKTIIEESDRTIARGGALAGNAAESMRQVVESVKSVEQVIAEINSASREQSIGIEEINKAVIQMDQITQDDAAMAEKLIVTAEILHGQSSQMLAAISAFGMQDAGVASTGGYPEVAVYKSTVDPKRLPVRHAA